jgi:hypothetical protein
MSLQIAPVFDIQKTKTTNMLYVTCPFCLHTHKHGETDVLNKKSFGTRMSHCLKNKRVYSLVLKCPVSDIKSPEPVCIITGQSENVLVTFS